MAFEDYEDFSNLADQEEIEERSITCKLCGNSGFEWDQTSRGWRLFDADGTEHNCRLVTHPLIKVHS